MNQIYLGLPLLPPYIIEEIRKRKEQEHKRERVPLRLPLPPADDPMPQDVDEQDNPDRGVVIIDLVDSIDSIL